jgi:hypothetical protein
LLKRTVVRAPAGTLVREYLVNASKVTVQARAIRFWHHNSADPVLLCRRPNAANVCYWVCKVLVAWTA